MATLKHKLVQEVAEELGFKPSLESEGGKPAKLSHKATSRIVESQFAYAASLMKSGTLDGVRFPYIGSMQVKQGRINYVNNPLHKEL